MLNLCYLNKFNAKFVLIFVINSLTNLSYFLDVIDTEPTNIQ